MHPVPGSQEKAVVAWECCRRDADIRWIRRHGKHRVWCLWSHLGRLRQDCSWVQVLRASLSNKRRLPPHLKQQQHQKWRILCIFNQAGKKEDILKRHSCPSLWLSDSWNNGRNWSFLRSLRLREGTGWKPSARQRRNLSSSKSCYTVLITCQTTLQKRKSQDNDGLTMDETRPCKNS